MRNVVIKLTENELDDLKTVLDWVCDTQNDHYLECLEEAGYNEVTENHIYNLANSLRSLTWEKV